MQTKKLLPDLFAEAYRAVATQYHDVLREAVQQAGFPEQWVLLWLVLECEPEPATIEALVESTPYRASQGWRDSLNTLVDAGLLVLNDAGEYRLQADARDRLLGVIARLNDHLATLEPLPLAELERLERILGRYISHAEALPEPANKPNLTRNRHSHPAEASGLVPVILQYITDNAAWRDDCHIAAWKPLEIPGFAMETFSLIWAGEAENAEQVFEKRPNRGYDVEVYRKALATLAARGWVVANDGVYGLTTEGRQVRDRVEDETDRLYQAALADLEAQEIDDLAGILAKLRETLAVAEAA